MLAFTAWYSYGARTEVLNTWMGYPNATYAPSTTGTGTFTSGLLTSSWNAVNSDRNFLMWRDVNKVTTNGTDYSLYGKLWEYGADQNYTMAMIIAILSCTLDIVLMVLSWNIFDAYFYYRRDIYLWQSAPVNAAIAYDEMGCDDDGFGRYGNECPPPTATR